MAGIVHAMKDMMTLLKTSEITNGDGNAVVPYVRVWNNQTVLDERGEMEAFAKPAFFLQVMPIEWRNIGNEVREADVSFKIHIVHEFYDAQDGTMEQDLAVFEFRDIITYLMTYGKFAGCGPLTCVGEEQDDKHKNIYELILELKCNFTDYKASRNDPAWMYWRYTTPPTTATISATVSATATPAQPADVSKTQKFIYPVRPTINK